MEPSGSPVHASVLHAFIQQINVHTSPCAGNIQSPRSVSSPDNGSLPYIPRFHFLFDPDDHPVGEALLLFSCCRHLVAEAPAFFLNLLSHTTRGPHPYSFKSHTLNHCPAQEMLNFKQHQTAGPHLSIRMQVIQRTGDTPGHRAQPR